MIEARLHFMMLSILVVLLIGISIPTHCRGEDSDGTAEDDLFSMSLEDLMDLDITDMVDEEERADSFFRHWYYIKEYRSQLSSRIRKADNQKSEPLRLLVYQCDAGQQTLSYAVDLLEAGLQNFAILAVTCPGQEAVVPRDLAYAADSFNRLKRESSSYNMTSLKNFPAISAAFFLRRTMGYRSSGAFLLLAGMYWIRPRNIGWKSWKTGAC